MSGITVSSPDTRIATVIVARDGSGDFNCDGVDDDVEINAAIDSLPATGGCVFIKEGTYNISNSIVIDVDNTSIVGTGRATEIRTTSNINMIYASGLSGLLISQLYFYGPGGNIGYGIRFDNVSNSIIFNNWIENVGWEAIALRSGNDNNIIERNILENNRYGIDLDTSDYNIISSNIFKNQIRDDILIFGDYNIIRGNILFSGNDRGIVISGQYNIIVGNIITDTTNQGIRLPTDADNNVISGNVLEGIGTGGGDAGISLQGADYNVITGNRLLNNSPYDIDLSAWGVTDDSNKNLIVNNVLSSDGIDDDGVETQIFNNIET